MQLQQARPTPLQWIRCAGLSSALPGVEGREVAFHDLDRPGTAPRAISALLARYSNALWISTRRGAHLVSFDLVDHATAAASKADLADLGQDPDHTAAHARYGRSILRVSEKYDRPDLASAGMARDRRNARPWSGPHWDFYRSLLGLPALPTPGPLDLRVEGAGSVILEIYYTPQVI